MITLECGNQRITLSILEAENLLRIQDKMRATSWELPSHYQRKADGTIVRTNTEAGSRQTKKK